MKKKIDYRMYIAIGIVVVAFALSIIFSFQSYVRTWESIKYLGRSLITLFSFGVKPEDIIVPLAPNLDMNGLTGTTLPGDFKELIYWFKTFSIAFFNRDIIINYLYDCLVAFFIASRYAILIPIVLLIAVLLRLLVLSKRPENIKGDSQYLILFKRFEQKYVAPVKTCIKGFGQYWRKHIVFTVLIVSVIALTYRGAAMAIDVIASYFFFCKTFSLTPIFGLVISIIIDVTVVLYSANQLIMTILVILGLLWLRKKSGRNYLNRMQTYNEKIASDSAIITMISGTVGSGKTMMVTSLAQDHEKLMRNKLFEIIKKYHLMFPNFPWANFEAFIRHRIRVDGKKHRRLVNRAQIEAEIKGIYDLFITRLNRWKLRTGHSHKRPYFFGYDYMSYGLYYWNGIRQISLVDALVAYGQAFFLYDVDKPLSAANYSIRFDFERKGYFPIYKYDYVNRNKEDRWASWNKYFASIMKMDYHRITNQRSIDPNEYFQFDGGVEAITEIDKERLNNPEQAGLEKRAEEANQKNDGWNKDYKITRHKHMIDNEVIFSSIVDTQREASVNLDFVETAEDHVRIRSKSETKVTIPLFDFDYLLCAPLVKAFNDWYHKYRSLRKDNSLFNYLFMKLATLANNHLTLLLEEFAYQELNFRKEIGKTADESGERYRQTYYIIGQKVFGSYRTDCYAAFLNEQKIDVRKGFYDAITYASTLATPQELELMLSYWIDELKKHAARS
ncbi:MAG: hypothetical protein PHE87_10705, partial [Victivallaceae bacterium]|nr:hypothetical protein [Victivallaceae bacterium]